MTGPEHYRQAEELLANAGDWMDADYGWKANLTAAERRAYKMADLGAAQVHATLALATAFVDGPAVMRPEDRDDWDHATGRTS